MYKSQGITDENTHRGEDGFKIRPQLGGDRNKIHPQLGDESIKIHPKRIRR